jgi:hypothetical protein
MLLGLEDGTIQYFQNNSVNSSPSFTAPVSNFASIDVGQMAAPQLFDLDSDGILDLVVGEKTGTLQYFQNQGSANAPNFVLLTPQLGGIDIQTATPDGFPVPHFFRWNDTTYLIVGGYDGQLRFYDSIDNHLVDTFHLKVFPFLGLDVGTFSAVSVDDVDHDGKLDLYLGQDLGGIFRLEHQAGANLSLTEPQEQHLLVYPNPARKALNLRGAAELGSLKVYSLEGKLVLEHPGKASEIVLDIEHLQQGLYTLILESGFKARFVKE